MTVTGMTVGREGAAKALGSRSLVQLGDSRSGTGTGSERARGLRQETDRSRGGVKLQVLEGSTQRSEDSRRPGFQGGPWGRTELG